MYEQVKTRRGGHDRLFAQRILSADGLVYLLRAPGSRVFLLGFVHGLYSQHLVCVEILALLNIVDLELRLEFSLNPLNANAVKASAFAGVHSWRQIE